jgi:hypothetical protein
MLIQIKRSPNNQPPASLAPGELAWAEAAKTGFIGLISGGVQPVFGDGVGYLKANQPITISGDVAGSGATEINLSLANIGQGGSGIKVTYDTKGRVTAVAGLQATDIPALAIGGVTGLQAVLDSKATLVNGKISPDSLPALATTETFVVASQAQMLALTAQRGDMAVRTDGTGTFILQGENPATLANWVRLNSPDSVAGGVQTVNDLPGPNVFLVATNIPFQPTGGLVGANIQAAIAELDSKKLSANQNINVTGDVTGSGSTAITLTLATIPGLSTGTYTKVAVNSKGLVTAAGVLAAADIPTIAISQVADLQATLDSKMNSSSVIDGGTF